MNNDSFGLGILGGALGLLVLLLVAAKLSEGMDRGASLERLCPIALEHATATDSLRIFQAAPECAG